VGKDIVYFHALFWPAVLHGADFRKPSGVFTHGFVTVDGKKMSKRRGTFIMARTYLDHLSPEYLRYYYASRLGPGVDDVDLNLDDFVQRVNSDLVGKLVNIASRCAKLCGGKLGPNMDPTLTFDTADTESIAARLEGREYAKAITQIMAQADKVNAYIADRAPWKLAKEGGNEDAVKEICTTGLNWFRRLMIMLKPVLPQTAAKAEAFFGEDTPWTWQDANTPLLDCEINPYTPLMTRLEKKSVDALVSPPVAEAKTDNEISIDDFTKIDLRVARVTKASLVEGADKLLQLELDVGEHERTVFAGVRAAYNPKDLEGKLVVLVKNLKPRKMKFGVSEGMVLAAGPGGSEIFVVSPDSGAKPGMRVK
ncbi:MAG: methionine--tRNA ligase subunit beta, partial [Pseudomonadota bacterium]